MLKAGFCVLVEKESCVREAWSDDPLITRYHYGRFRAGDIGYSDKCRQQLTVLCQMEITLVLFHRRDQNLSWNGKEGFIKMSCKNHRPFNESRNFVKQFRIKRELGIFGHRYFFEAIRNFLASGVEVDFDIMFQASVDIDVRAGQFKLTVTHEPMAHRLSS